MTLSHLSGSRARQELRVIPTLEIESKELICTRNCNLSTVSKVTVKRSFIPRAGFPLPMSPILARSNLEGYEDP